VHICLANKKTKVVLENNENVRTKAFWQTRKRGNKVVLANAELLHLKKVMSSNPELN